ncbi:oligosaccharide flippase family protein [Heyndrickxia sp. MSNUG]|uniref:oligosaccharide flippase family protein n=1 Tax=Heyndrickxia sp. MSNUG TaxID=3136677 RepID=UPI003C305BFD
MGNITRFLKTSGTYFIGNVLSKLIVFFLLPLYTSELVPKDFGTFDLVVTLLSFFAPIAFFQIWDGMFRYSFDKHNNKEKYDVISNSFVVLIIGFLLYTFMFVIAYKIIHFELDLLIFFYGLMVAINYQYTFIARVFLKNTLFVMTGILNTLLNAILNFILIVYFNLGVESLYISFIAGALLQVILIELNIHPIAKFRLNRLNKKLQLEMVKFSIPLCLASISYWLLSGYTRIVIAQELGNAANGLYAVANRFGSLISLIVSIFQFAWNEMVYLMAKENDRFQKYELSMKYILKVIVFGSAILMLIIKIIFPHLIHSDYQDALLLVPLTLIGIAFNSFAGFLGTIFMTEKNTKYILTTTVFGAVINIILLWTLTPLLGIQGAIGALCLAFVALSFIRAYMVRKVIHINFPLIQFAYYLIFLSIVMYIFFNVETTIGLLLYSTLLICILAFSLRNLIKPLLSMLFNKLKN